MCEVIVTGGRYYDDAERVYAELEAMNPTKIIQGGAGGADLFARLYAEDNNIPLVTHKADWNKYGRAAGPIRNEVMLLSHPQAKVIAFPGGRGTQNCIDTAKRHKFEVIEITL